MAWRWKDRDLFVSIAAAEFCASFARAYVDCVAGDLKAEDGSLRHPVVHIEDIIYGIADEYHSTMFRGESDQIAGFNPESYRSLARDILRDVQMMASQNHGRMYRLIEELVSLELWRLGKSDWYKHEHSDIRDAFLMTREPEKVDV